MRRLFIDRETRVVRGNFEQHTSGLAEIDRVEVVPVDDRSRLQTRSGDHRTRFEFGGIVWENYGQIDTGDFGINTLKARFFPSGVPNLFKTYYAPADYIETVNTLGQRLYAKQYPMPNDKGINGELQMNALQLCTRPGALMGARNT